MRPLLLAVSLVLSAGTSALGQDAGQIGISLGYPSAVGIVWHVTERVAVRPAISFLTGSTDSGSSGFDLFGSAASDEVSSTSVTAGVSGLLYFGKWDKLRAYVSPGYTYGHATSSSGSAFASDNRHSTYVVAGSFGAHYQLHRRFAVFGETGFGYTHSRTTLTTTLALPVITPGLNVPTPVSRSEEIVSHSWGNQAGAGVIFYFK